MTQYGTLRVYLTVSYYHGLKEREVPKQIQLFVYHGIAESEVKSEVAKQRKINPDCVCVFTPDSITY